MEISGVIYTKKNICLKTVKIWESVCRGNWLENQRGVLCLLRVLIGPHQGRWRPFLSFIPGSTVSWAGKGSIAQATWGFQGKKKDSKGRADLSHWVKRPQNLWNEATHRMYQGERPHCYGTGEYLLLLLVMIQTLRDARQKWGSSGGREDPDGAYVCNIWNKLLKKVALTEFVKVEEGQLCFFWRQRRLRAWWKNSKTGLR